MFDPDSRVSPSQLLASFFLTCFCDHELRRWLRLTPRHEALLHHLPGGTASVAEVSHAAAELLVRHGLIDDALLGSLVNARPERRGDVQMLGVALGLHPASSTSTDDVDRFLRRTVGDELRVLLDARCESAALDRLVDVTQQVPSSSRLVREAHTLSAEWRQLENDTRREPAATCLGSERANLRDRLEALAGGLPEDSGDSAERSMMPVMTPRMRAAARIYSDLHMAVRRNDGTSAVKRLLDLAYAYGNARSATAQAGELTAALERWYAENPRGTANDQESRKRRAVLLDDVLSLGTTIFRGIRGEDKSDDGVRETSSPARTAAPILVCAEDLAKSYRGGSRFFGLSQVSVEIRATEIVGLVGTNGSGKSTLLKILAGELRQDAGRLTFPELEVPRISPGRRWERLKGQIGYIPQRTSRWEHSLVESLHRWAALHGIVDDENEYQVNFFLQRLGLDRYRDATWVQLSGGYQMRAALAMTLVTRPRLLLLDEPLAHLDIAAQRHFLADLEDLASLPETRMAVVLSSQHILEVESVANTMICLAPHGAATYVGPYPLPVASGDGRTLLISADASLAEIERGLKGIPAARVHGLGKDAVIELPDDVTPEAVLRHLSASGVVAHKIQDISRSAMRVFVQ